MAGKISTVKTIKEHSQQAFDEQARAYIDCKQKAGYACKTQFTPLMQPDGKIIYMGLIEVRE